MHMGIDRVRFESEAPIHGHHFAAGSLCGRFKPAIHPRKTCLSVENAVRKAICMGREGAENRGFLRFLRVHEIKLQKGVDPTQCPTYMAPTDAALPVSHWLRSLRSPTFVGQPVPRCKSGCHCCPPLLLDGSLTLLVFDEGTCGRRRPVRGF